MTPLLDRIAGWARTKPDAVAYTFVDYLADPDGVTHACTWGSLWERSVRLAQRLRAVAGPGERVAILAPSGLEYVLALIASWYAGAVAVPLFAPGLPGHAERLAATFADCDPACVVTVPACAGEVRDFVAGRAPVLVVDGDRIPRDTGWRPRPACADDVAYLQYSSGSTRAPAGVEITHGNLTANVTQLCDTLTGGRPHITGVNWLPLFHDMGLLATVAVPLRAGTDAVFLDPVAFLMQPARWLRLLSGRASAYTAAPNFAYDYCLRRLAPDDLAGLDLGGVFLWINGAEPVRAATLDRFADRIGLDRRAICPAYGLAEATVYVAGHGIDRPPRVVAVDRDRLAAGRAVAADDGAGRSELVSCGPPAGQRVAVVDPGTGAALPDGRVGEIWVHGPNVARRYWRQDERSREVFGARLAGESWLRTGDLGVLLDGELFVTGRLKDLLIVAGRNHYPQDVEETVGEAAPALGRAAAFTVLADDQERAVVVAEWSRPAVPARPAEVAREVRQAVWRRHDLALHDLVLAEPGAIPRTTSGKVSRTGCRARYLGGHWSRAAAARDA
jgi:fatty acid CoA ligase FadD32